MANLIPKIEYGTTPTTIEFEYPPKGKDPFGKKIRTKSQLGESANGETQTSFLANIQTNEFVFSYVSKTIIDALETFYLTHASRGLTFKYFFDKDEAGFIEVELDKSSRKFEPKSIFYKSADNDFRYELKMKVRQVL